MMTEMALLAQRFRNELAENSTRASVRGDSTVGLPKEHKVKNRTAHWGERSIIIGMTFGLVRRASFDWRAGTHAGKTAARQAFVLGPDCRSQSGNDVTRADIDRSNLIDRFWPLVDRSVQ